MENNPTPHTKFARYDPAVTQYCCWEFPDMPVMPWLYTDWQEETQSWKKTCYLHTFLSGCCPNLRVKGPDAERLMSDHFVNSFPLDKFPVGSCKHVIACDKDGFIVTDGVCLRTAEDQFDTYCLDPVLNDLLIDSDYNIEHYEPQYDQDFIFQIAGPRSLEVVENVIREDIHDLKFMRFRSAKVLGRDVRVLRMGMGGTLSYELHGNVEDALTVYDEIIRVGAAYGLKRLGLLSYSCNHTENGFPQAGVHFMSSNNRYETEIELHGSMSDMGIEAYFANPFEVGWGKAINWNHNFVGKDALQKIAANPATRSICTLEWNSEDIMKIFTGYFDESTDALDLMVLPQNYYFSAYGNLADKVFDKDGNLIGKSGGIVYTRYYKKVITLGLLTPNKNVQGDEVVILWGTAGTRQIPIRAKITRYPYLDLTSNREYNVEDVPHFIPSSNM